MHFEAQGAGRWPGGGADMATGLCSKCVTVTEMSSEGTWPPGGGDGGGGGAGRWPGGGAAREAILETR